MPKKPAHNWGYPTSAQDAEEGLAQFEKLMRDLEAPDQKNRSIKLRRPATGIFILSVSVTLLIVVLDRGLMPHDSPPGSAISRTAAFSTAEHNRAIDSADKAKDSEHVWNCRDTYTNNSNFSASCAPLSTDTKTDAKGNKFLTRPWDSE